MSKNSAGIEISKKDQPVFIDTSIFIYLFENHPKYAPLIEPVFNEAPLLKVTSLITLSEVLSKPYQNQNTDLIKKYSEIFMHLPNLSLKTLDYESAVLASQIRASYNFKLLDAFQLSLARQAGCKSFFTNDKSLKKFKGIEIIYLDEVIKAGND